MSLRKRAGNIILVRSPGKLRLNLTVKFNYRDSRVLINLLFICTHNRCRSILAEAITNHHGQGKIHAYSAGSSPVGEVHPLSLRYLKQCGYETKGLKSQSWEVFEKVSIDLVITVCDSAAQEACPIWLGKTKKVHWPIADPSKAKGSDEEIEKHFLRTIKIIEAKVEKFIELAEKNLPQEKLLLELKRTAEKDSEKKLDK